ncbi:type VI secretion system baseplate subunit TssF [Marinimicrobium alkaliphilum]|uniref:type VI secretion system baseplate subunit TssF n=1 Tax=Marinimicrobium alkaliphilum TaxID=2202654 RepID=UPI000DBA36E8|nr:type VI secretion system baseplate subunit TssF [Marinimicrobium alkaliphilum]
MADELLPYYEKELAFIRQMGAEFAKENPKIASRLGINTDTIEDPHVSRLVESVAYLNARIQHRLDDDFPELSDSLLNTLFPHYQRPIPSMAIACFEPDPEQLEATFTLAKGTLLETKSFKGETCRFTTAYDTELVPAQVASAQLMGRPFSTPGSDAVRSAASVLKLRLSAHFDESDLQQVMPERLRLYLKGQPQHIHPLYELLINRCENVVISAGHGTGESVFLGKDAVKAVGFEADQGLLPYPDNAFIGYRLLTEYFAFPEKFMFVDIQGLDLERLKGPLPHLDIYIYLSDADVELEHNVDATTFVLGCTPVVNLFEHQTDPIEVDHRHHEYQIIPDVRRPSGYEVYSVDEVIAADPYGKTATYRAFYGLNHDRAYHEDQVFWYARREHAKAKPQERDEGTDVYLSLVDLDFQPGNAINKTLMVKTTCSNRDQPARLPFSAREPALQCVDASPPTKRIRCLTQPTESIRPPLGNGARWRLISHLQLNQRSIAGDGATEALQEMLRLYDFQQNSAHRSLIEAIDNVQVRPVNAPIQVAGRPTLCRGMEVTVTVDDRLLAGISLCLFTQVLEQFFALYCSLNSFSRLRVRRKQQDGFYKECPVRIGVQS